jgi:hypothetical protein
VSLSLCLPSHGAAARRPPRPEHGSAYLGGAPAPTPVLAARILAIRLSDDDGSRAARITPEQVSAWLEFANQAFHPAGVRFDFDGGPGDFQALRSSLLNRLDDTSESWPQSKGAADELAARFPDRLVVFFRHGEGRSATGYAFSGIDQNFIAMPGWPQGRRCRLREIRALAHELGHHLGLEHTFARAFDDVFHAELFLDAHHGNFASFDGDGLADTPPDPGITSPVCASNPRASIDGVSVRLPRRNLMSYYPEGDSLTRQQAARVRWFLQERMAHRMKLPKNTTSTQVMEGERLRILAQEGCRAGEQAMDEFGKNNWSAGAQLFCRSLRHSPVRVTVLLPVKESGRYWIDLYTTRAPDYGVLEVLVDGQPLGPSIDAWAPAVLASGSIRLGARRLSAGTHDLTFRAAARNPASADFHLGIDALALIPAGRGS